MFSYLRELFEGRKREKLDMGSDVGEQFLFRVFNLHVVQAPLSQYLSSKH
jgi:hypothetical protein